MSLTGEEFFKQFFCRFQDYVKKDRKKYERTTSDTAWTKYLKDGFLSELANGLGFDEIKSEGIHGIDLTWKRSSDGMSIAIEHENELKTIWNKEVPNLLEAIAPLKVLITYVKDTYFPGTEIANRLLKFLKKKNFGQEFLLILGTDSLNEPTDWIGYLYRPELAFQHLHFCSNILEAESKPAVKAWKTRRKGSAKRD